MNAANCTPQLTWYSDKRTSQKEEQAAENVLDTIGTATMQKDGTIILSLIYQFPKGGHTTPAEFIYKPSHPEYKNILNHIGHIKPGEFKGVKPWKTKIDVAPPDFNAPLSPELKDFPWPEK